jgi:hypothetical protein
VPLLLDHGAIKRNGKKLTMNQTIIHIYSISILVMLSFMAIMLRKILEKLDKNDKS